MPVIDRGTAKFCTDCRMKFAPNESGICPHCKGKGIPEMAKSKVKVEGRGK